MIEKPFTAAVRAEKRMRSLTVLSQSITSIGDLALPKVSPKIVVSTRVCNCAVSRSI